MTQDLSARPSYMVTVKDYKDRSRLVSLPDGWKPVYGGISKVGDKWLDMIELSHGRTVFQDLDPCEVGMTLHEYSFSLLIRKGNP